MTPRQMRVVDFVRERIETTGVSPTIAEIKTGLGALQTTVHRSINRAVAAGLLLRIPYCDRGLRLPGVDLSTVPTAELTRELRLREQRRTA